LPIAVSPELIMSSRFYAWLLGASLAIASTGEHSIAVADGPASEGAIPSQAAVAELLTREPFTRETWPQWRPRLLAWIVDRGQSTEAAYGAAREFISREAHEKESLPDWLDGDAFAWYVWGGALLRRTERDPAAVNRNLELAESAFRKSIQLDHRFARAHRNLALTLIQRELMVPKPVQVAAPAPAIPPKGLSRRAEDMLESLRKKKAPVAAAQNNLRFIPIEESLATAAALEPDLSLSYERGLLAFLRKDFVASERSFRQAMLDFPDQAAFAGMVARAVNSQETAPAGGSWGAAIKPLVERYPEVGELRAQFALALARDGQFVESDDELNRARQLGCDPVQLFGRPLVDDVHSRARPARWTRWVLWAVGAFVATYLAMMVLMAGGGLILAARTRGAHAAELLRRPAEQLVQFGRVARGEGESLLAKLYMFGLMIGLVMFYIAVPFLVLGLLAGTGGALYLVFMLPRIPIKLIAIVVVVGGGLAWAVLNSIFASTGRGGFGLVKTASECPRLHETVRTVAQLVDTPPVDEIYLAPGSAIGVHQEGRGPFGIFGVKRRVLTLGMSMMRYLTISELKAILAHEYGHFSHKDTFYSRPTGNAVDRAGADRYGTGGGQAELRESFRLVPFLVLPLV
jgi:Zn-dependent protease with chaperone function